MKHILIIILLLVISFSSFSQSLNEKQLDFLESVYDHYATAKSFSMDVEVSAFDENKNLVMPVQLNKSVKSSEQYLVETPAMINLITSDFQLVVDHANQIVQLNPLTEKTKSELQSSSIEHTFPSRESLLADSTIIFSETEDLVQLRMIDQLSENNYLYTFNKKRKILERIDYYMPANISGQPTHVQVHYLNKNINKGIPENTFSLEKFLNLDQEEKRLMEDYKHYTFIDNTKAK